MRYFFALLVVGLFCVSIGWSAPDPTLPWRKLKVTGELTLPAHKFLGGERAAVIVIGDHQPVEIVSVIVKNSQGDIVARDSGAGAIASDFAAVVWYPPRTDTYSITITTTGPEYNACGVAIR